MAPVHPSLWHRASSLLRHAAGPARSSGLPFILAIALLLAVVLSALAATILVRTYNDAIAAAQHRIEDFTDLLAEHAMLVFDDVDRTLQTAGKARAMLMRAGQWGPSAGDRPYRALLELQPSSAAASNLSWTDEHGDRLYTALSPSPSPLNVRERPYFIRHRDDPALGIHVGTPNLSQQTGKYLVPVTCRFDLPDGGFGGVTTLLIDPAYFASFYQSTTRRQRLFIQLVLNDGTVLAREPSQASYTGASIAQGQLFTQHLPKAPAGTFSAPGVFDGIDRIVSYKAIPKLPLVITVSINRSDALADWYRASAIVLAFYAVLLAMIGGGAWLGSRQIHRRALRRREQAEAEARRRQAEKQQALSTMIGGIAHEINNALMPIMINGEMLEEELAEGSFERVGLGQMMHCARQIEGLIKRVLDMNRGEAAAGVPLDLAGFLARVADKSRAGLPKSIALIERVADDIGAVQAGEETLSRVFVELVSNAASAIGDNPGRIEISAAPAFVDAGPADTARTRFVRLSVRDDGPGIPPAVRERLFEPFFTTKDAGKGVGLGLYAARRVVSELGGYLDVESEPGKGACFSILLPRVPAQVTAAAAAA